MSTISNKGDEEEVKAVAGKGLFRIPSACSSLAESSESGGIDSDGPLESESVCGSESGL